MQQEQNSKFKLEVTSYELTCIQIDAEQKAAAERKKARDHFQWAKANPVIGSDAMHLAAACNKEAELWERIAKACKAAVKEGAQ